MYQLQVVSDDYVLFNSKHFNSFVDLINETYLEFDYPDCKGYEICLLKDGKLLNSFVSFFCYQEKSFKEINS